MWTDGRTDRHEAERRFSRLFERAKQNRNERLALEF
jgi:hypothetical protein